MQDIIFGRCLREPGYKVDFAVGSTYSLNLDTFISLPFSLGFLEEPDEVMKKSVPYIFSALRLCSDRLAVFCNYADIKVPAQTRKVYYALMEGSVFPVNAGGKRKQIVNFHPKVWVVKQTGIHGEGSIIRVIIMSRNLTGDGDMDCACVLTGQIGKKQASASSRRRHSPLRDFLRYLAKKADHSKKRIMIEAMAEDLLKVESFDIDSSLYDDYEFLPMGIPGYSGMDALDDLSHGYRLVVVSPFIDDATMQRFAHIGEKLLVTQDFSITGATVKAFGKENIYTTNPQLQDNDIDAEVNLHAKMFFATRWYDGQKNYLYLGSTNATMGGFDRNVEFMIRLRYAPYKMSWHNFAAYFKEDTEKKFTPMVDVIGSSNSRLEEYRQSVALRRAIISVRGAVVIEEGERYAVNLTVDECDVSARIYPLLRPDLKEDLLPGLSFHGLSLINLSEFYVIETEILRSVVKIPTEGLPREKRDDAICKEVIRDKAQFMDCISFLLSESKAAYVIGKEYDRILSGESGGGSSAMSFPAIYENLLREAYESPETFEDIRTFVESLPKEVIPEDFGKLYDKFLKAIKGLH